MADMVVGGKEKLKVMIFSRSMGILNTISYESRKELVDKFFPNKENVIYFQGISDTTEDPVDHYFDKSGVGEFVGITIVRLAERHIVPVQARVRNPL